jgi:hypothetical protein
LTETCFQNKEREREGGGGEREGVEESPHAPCEEHIMVPEQLHVWAAAKIYSVACAYCTADDYGEEMIMLYYRCG